MKITVFTDDPSSWFVPYGRVLAEKLNAAGHKAACAYNAADVSEGDVCFMLSCVKIAKNELLARNANNIVVHAGDLPQGKGFSPLQWQVEQGSDEVTLTLFEAVAEVDAGPYYLKSRLRFNGTELLPELRKAMAEKIVEMCLEYAQKRASLKPVAQSGESSFFRKRTEADDELDAAKSINDNFNHLRIADNDKFPLYFKHKGRKYYLKIYAAAEPEKGPEKGGAK